MVGLFDKQWSYNICLNTFKKTVVFIQIAFYIRKILSNEECYRTVHIPETSRYSTPNKENSSLLRCYTAVCISMWKSSSLIPSRATVNFTKM